MLGNIKSPFLSYVCFYILTLTLGSLIAKLSDKTTAQFETVITPSESQFFFLKHDGFQNIIYFETFFTKNKM